MLDVIELKKLHQELIAEREHYIGVPARYVKLDLIIQGIELGIQKLETKVVELGTDHNRWESLIQEASTKLAMVQVHPHILQSILEDLREHERTMPFIIDRLKLIEDHTRNCLERIFPEHL